MFPLPTFVMEVIIDHAMESGNIRLGDCSNCFQCINERAQKEQMEKERARKNKEEAEKTEKYRKRKRESEAISKAVLKKGKEAGTGIGAKIRR